MRGFAAAAAVALGYGLAVLAAASRGRLGRPWLIAAFAAGALLFPLSVAFVTQIQALLASVAGWDVDAFGTSLGIGLAGAVVAAAISEILKLAVALLALSREGADPDPVAIGAAVGAGFGAVGAYQVLAMALIARGLQIAPDNLAVPLAQQLGFVAANAGSTALAAYGVARGRLGPYLAGAVVYQTLFGLLSVLFAMQVFPMGVWTAVTAAVGVALLAWMVVLGARLRTSIPPA